MKRISSKRAKALAIDTDTKRIVFERDGGICVWCGRRGIPEAHFIPRSKGGLGIPENILTLCRPCHDRYDNGSRRGRELMRDRFREYLKERYPEWDETKLIYRKDNTYGKTASDPQGSR